MQQILTNLSKGSSLYYYILINGLNFSTFSKKASSLSIHYL